MSTATVKRDGTVVCRECSARLGEVFRDPDGGEEPWWAEHADGEAAGFGPEPTRRGAVFLLTSLHECEPPTQKGTVLLFKKPPEAP